jgi:hypothetical protein
MKNPNKYGLGSLRKDFPTEDACLEFIYSARHTDECSCGGTYARIKGRKQWQCGKCRFQIAPLAGTIFHKSDTPLSLWFHAIMVFSNAKSGMSASALQRDLEVTYKTAWRMLKLIREALGQNGEKLDGIVEIDSGYIGGTAPLDKRMDNKSTVIAAVERKGGMKARVVPDGSAEAHRAFLELHVQRGARLMSDKTNKLTNSGYPRETVDHHKREYVRGDVYVNSVENFWSHVKRSIKGTHKNVSPKHLQSYLDGFVFHANNRRNDRERFFALLSAVLQPKSA